MHLPQVSKQPGETIYKGHRSYDLMLNLQLGIRFTVGRINSKPAPSTLSDSEFRRTVRARRHPGALVSAPVGPCQSIEGGMNTGGHVK